MAEARKAPYPWLWVVVHQSLREVAYFALGIAHAASKCATGKKRSKPQATDQPDPKTSSAKTVLFIRHGQGDHNKSIKNWKIIDPSLNDAGQRQAAELHKRLGGPHGHLVRVELVVTSPLTRAMQTARYAFKGVNVRWAVNPLLRERMGAPCDEGLPRSELLAKNPHMRDWEGIDELNEVWWTPAMEWGLFTRISELEKWVAARPESTIALVGHGGLFARILGYHLHNCGHQWVSWDPASAPKPSGAALASSVGSHE